MANSTRMEVTLADEAPRIGSGRRIVEVEVGRKWVKLRGPHGSGKLTLERWRQIAHIAKELPPKKRRRRRKAEPCL